jgi:protein O-mannosyl-transferase
VKHHWAILIVLVMTVATFAPTGRFGFLDWDDVDLVAENPLLHQPDAAALKAFWTRPQIGLYTPMAYSLWWVIAKCGLRSGCFHSLNIALHLLAALAVYALLLQLGNGTGRHTAAALGAAVFALHPLQVEAVAWISGMNNLLAGLFGLASIALYLRSVSKKSSASFWLATALFGLALLSKPTAVVVPLVAMVLDWGIKGRTVRQVASNLWLWIVMAAVMGVVAHSVQPANLIPAIPVTSRLLVAVDSVGFYLTKIFVPMNLTVDYGRMPGHIAALGWTWLAMLALAIGAMAIFLPQRWAAIVVLFVAAALPTLGLMAFDFQRYSTVADRYVYLAMLAPAIFVWALVRNWPRTAALVGLAVILMAVGSEIQLQYWQNDVSLFQRNLVINPQSLAANQVLGFAAARAGDRQTAMQFDLAGLAHHSEDPVLNFAIGNLLLTADPATAAQRYVIAIRGLPKEARFHNNYGVALAELGRKPEAAHAFRTAIELAPGWQDPINNLKKATADAPSGQRN